MAEDLQPEAIVDDVLALNRKRPVFNLLLRSYNFFNTLFQKNRGNLLFQGHADGSL